MFSTNIVTVNNFYKRLASVFIAIALMMMTSMLVACGKKEDIVHSQECNVIYELRGFYATNEKCYSYCINVSADDELTKELYNLVKKECRKQENDVFNMNIEDDLQYGSDVQGSVVKSFD